MLFKAILAFNIMIVLKVFKMNQCYDATQQNYLHLVWKRTPFSSLLSYNSIAARLLQNLSKAIDSRSLLLFPVIRYFVRFENKFDLYSFLSNSILILSKENNIFLSIKRKNVICGRIYDVLM